MNKQTRVNLKSIVTASLIITVLLYSTVFVKSLHNQALDHAIQNAPERMNQYSKSFHIDFSDITKQ